jgi:hypothetical protein
MMKIFAKALMSAVLLLQSWVVQAECNEPGALNLEPFTQRYEGEVKLGMSVSAEATRSMTKSSEGIYTLTNIVTSRWATLQEYSRFRVCGTRIIPLSYERSNTGDKGRSLSFDWDNRQVHYLYKGKRGVLNMPQDGGAVFDRLTLTLQTAVDGSLGQRHYYEATGRRIKPRVFTAHGEQEATGLHYFRMDDGDKTIKLWVDSSLPCIPHKIYFKEGRLKIKLNLME